MLGTVSRRDFLRNAAIIAGGSFLAMACGTEATVKPTTAASASPASTGVSVAEDDPRIDAGPVEFQGNDATLQGYLSRPKEPGPHPAVLVVHENRGLLPHFPDVTRRLAAEGYAALAVDMLSREGGTASIGDPDKLRTALRDIPKEQVVADGSARIDYLRGLSYVQTDRVGAMGFCFGGSIVWLLAVRNPDLRTAVPFYGSAPPLEEIPNLQIPVLGIYAAEDNRINGGVPALEQALESNGKDFKFVTYSGANHAFFNDTGSRYRPQAAAEAWTETLNWFEEHLME